MFYCIYSHSSPLLFFPSSQTFLFIHSGTLRLQILSFSSVRGSSRSTEGLNLKDICETFCCCCGERGTLTFSFLLYVSLELKFYVFLLLFFPFFPAWETSHPDFMFFWHHIRIFSSSLMPPTHTVLVVIVYFPPSLPPSFPPFIC